MATIPVGPEGGGFDFASLFRKIPLAFLGQTVIWMVAVFTTYSAMRSELRTSIEQGVSNRDEIAKTQGELVQVRAQLVDARLAVQTVTVKLDMLISNYERDMNRYIRDARDRR